jgi:phenylpropionate dioxygenase-like ring-hydroxylating dioxygenase large terminal subunit
VTRARATLGNADSALRRSWHPVARTADVGLEPVAVQLLGEPWVLYRAGRAVLAWTDRCPHRFAPLSLGTVEDGRLRCAYHGWRFGPDGCGEEIPALGARAAVPSRARLRAPAGVAERYGLVWLAPDEPLAPLPDVDGYLGGLEMVEMPVLETRASAGLLADNFLDMAHFPFVHAATIGAGESTLVEPYSVERAGWSFSASYTHAFSNREDPGVKAGIRPLVQTRRMTYQYHAPFSLLLRLEYLDTGGINTIGFFIQPATAERCRIYSAIWRNDLDGDPIKAKQAVDFELAVIDEDLQLQSRFADLALPLDPTIEVHTRADRITVELRRVLSDLVAASLPDTEAS